MRQTRLLSILSLLGLFIATALLALLYRHVAVDHLLALGEEKNVALTQSLANSLGNELERHLRESRGLAADQVRQRVAETGLREAMLRGVTGLNVVKVKLYGLDGATVFSTDARQIGGEQADNPGVRAALAGGVLSELNHREQYISFDGEVEDRDLISSYLPLRHGNAVVGVLEIYDDVTRLLARIQRVQWVVAGVAGAIMVALYLGIVVVMRLANRIIQQEEASRNAYTGKLERLNEELEERVAVRAGELQRTNEALRTEVEVRRQAEAELNLAATVFRNMTEAVVITNTHGAILSINPAFSAVTGYTPDEAVGQTMRLVKSGFHDGEFYQEFWRQLHAFGRWQGEFWNRRKNGELYPQWAKVTAIRDGEGKDLQYVGIFTDVSERKATEEQIQFLAHFDPLTGLPNRMLLLDRLRQAMANTMRYDKLLAVMVLEVNGLKMINDGFGHGMGDHALKEAAQRVDGVLREGDTLARLGGNIFVLLVTGLNTVQDAARIAGEVLDGLGNRMAWEGHEFYISGRMGVSLFPFDQVDAETLLRNADTALTLARKKGEGGCEFFTKRMSDAFQRRLTVEQGLRRGLERGEFFLCYQPMYDVQSGRLASVEALVRWNSPDLGLVSPVHFIPVAEETGLIIPLGEWVLRNACRQSVLWRKLGFGPLRMAVNISARQLELPNFVRTVLAIIAETGVDPAMLDLEVTEGMVMEDVARSLTTLRELKEAGIHLSIDDFGTGYSSLSYLKRFPIHTLKVDRSFIQDLTTDPDDAAITRTIIAMAKNLNLEVVAEGVVSTDQLEFLRALGCDIVQGFLFSPPVVESELRDFLEEDRLLRQRLGERAPRMDMEMTLPVGMGCVDPDLTMELVA